MSEGELEIEFLSRGEQHSDYDWANLTYDSDRVGKARCLIDGNTLVIYSINVYPEFEGRGFGKAFVDSAKKKYSVIVADRVRKTAIGFWEKTGFLPDGTGNWVWRKSATQ